MRAFFKFIAYAVLIIVIAAVAFGVFAFKTGNSAIESGTSFLENQGYQSVRMVKQGTFTCGEREVAFVYKGDANGREDTINVCVDMLSPERVRIQK